MTRTEAIKILSCRDNRGVPIAWQDGFVDAVDTAIEALQENESLSKSVNDAAELIHKLQKNKWIPCSEKLPSNDDFVIITILDEHGDTKYRYSSFGWYLNVAKCWIVDDELRNDVVAWAPLPEPYKGE